MPRWLAPLTLVLACARPPTAAPTKPEAPAPAAEAAENGKHRPKKADPAFPGSPKRGWEALTTEQREQADAFAGDYAAFLGAAKTPEEVVTALVGRFSKGAAPLGRGGVQPGTRLWLPGPGGMAAAFVRVGERPPEEGLRILVAGIDAPRFDLRQQPFYTRSGLAMLDTVPYGDPDLPSWLAHPLALHLRAARPGSATGDLSLVVGEDPGDPVLDIPDLEPHLAGSVQRRQLVDSPERMDAVAAVAQQALTDWLAAHGISPRELPSAEAMLVPAGPPVFLGVDRARLAGYGHASRAVAFAAVRALVDGPVPRQTAVVILVGKQYSRWTGAAGEAFVRQATSQVIAALAGADADLLAVRRIEERSAILLARAGGEPGEGVTVEPFTDDALPPATRRVLDLLAAAGAQVQLSTAESGGEGADLASGDIDVVELGLPVTGRRTPTEVVSVFDLYQARLACQGWLTR